MIEQAAAASWNLPRGADYRLRYLTGRWAGEWTLTAGALARERRCSRAGAERRAPEQSVVRDRARRDRRMRIRARYGSARWRGAGRGRSRWSRISACRMRVTGGFNPFDFGYRLKPGEKFETPVFYGGYTRDGMGGASRLLHRFEVDAYSAAGSCSPRPRPVLYNSWEATRFNVNEAGQMALAEKAASIGVERFVMDDGWFGQRNDDHAGLGDWYVNKREVSQRAEAADRQGALAGDGLRHCGWSRRW